MMLSLSSHYKYGPYPKSPVASIGLVFSPKPRNFPKQTFPPLAPKVHNSPWQWRRRPEKVFKPSGRQLITLYLCRGKRSNTSSSSGLCHCHCGKSGRSQSRALTMQKVTQMKWLRSMPLLLILHATSVLFSSNEHHNS